LSTVGQPVREGAELFRLLADMEARSRGRSAGLPQQQAQEEAWEAVVFSVGDTRLVVAPGEVVEILNFPSGVSQVPGAKPWMRGIANIRGNILPIIDLQAFLGGPLTASTRRSRVLVFNQGEGLVGLLVGEMVGMRRFDQMARIGRRELAGRAGRFVVSGFEQGGTYWPLFSMRALAQDPEFQNGAR
jgi:twitching motility protein PilI